MSNPFQFSIREVFFLALLVCVGSPVVKMLVAVNQQDGAFIAAFFVVGGAIVGTVCLSLAGKPVAGAIGGAWAGLAIVAVLVWLASRH